MLTPDNLTDEELAALVHETALPEAQQAFGLLCDRLGPMLRRVLRAFKRIDMEDMHQSVLAKLWSSLREGKFDPARASLRQYAGIVAHSTALDSVRCSPLRKQTGFPEESEEVEEELPSREEDPAVLVAATEAKEKLRRAIQTLPERERQILGWHLEGLNWAEIGERLGMSRQLVHKVAQQAMDRIRNQHSSLGDE